MRTLLAVLAVTSLSLVAGCAGAPAEGEGEGAVGEGEGAIGEGEGAGGEGEGAGGEGEGAGGEGEGEGEGEGVAGEGEGEGAPVDLTPIAFAADHVVEIAITMDPADFLALSKERRSVVDILKPGCLDAPFPSPFNDYTAAVVIDGESFPQVHVKKRGFLGSLSEVKPGLNIHLNDFDATASWNGLSKLTLSNAVQDPSYVHTCMTYEIMASAGVPAPRCNFAHVAVNGVDKGVYVHIEAVKKAMLKRHFADGGGNLYEGTLSDFTSDYDKTFAKKSHTSDPSKPEVAAIEAALAADDAGLLAALDPVVDLSEFTSFWAAEVLVGHWDGYSGNQNNFFLYGDPSTGKASFLPWGPDQTFLPSLTTPFQSINARAELTRRLINIPESAAAYYARQQELLATVWDEQALNAEVDRMANLVQPFIAQSERQAAQDALVPVRDFINTRRQQITDELAAAQPSWTDPLRAPICFAPVGALDATFTTTFGSNASSDNFASGDGTWSGTIDGGTMTAALDANSAPQVGAQTGVDPNVPDGSQTIVFSVAILDDGRIFFYGVLMPTTLFGAGSFTVDDIDVQVLLFQLHPDANGGPPTSEIKGRAFDGTLTISQGTTTAGDPVVGSVHADFINVGF